MKKIALTSLIAMFAFAGANAATNYFVGGAANLVRTDADHSTLLTVAPELGYKVDANWDVGLGLNFTYDQAWLNTNYGVDGDTYKYGLDAFARYKVAQFGGFKLLVKGSVGMNFTTADPDVTGADTETIKTLGAAITPMITYDVSEAFTLYANLNFMGVRADYTFENKDVNVPKSWAVRAFADSSDVANTGAFQIGFNYNF